MRIKWEIALRRDGFAASDRTLLCSDHFRSEDFDRMGQNGATGERRLSRKQQATDHLYALPACPTPAMKPKLEEASARVRKVQREKINGFRRENRAKNNIQAVLEELKDKNLINEELKDQA
ncbi:unnamed protein product [Arctogadus glacialis]